VFKIKIKTQWSCPKQAFSIFILDNEQCTPKNK
jgi:hypothetical protein